jgi:hypothetical protein
VSSQLICHSNLPCLCSIRTKTELGQPWSKPIPSIWHGGLETGIDWDSFQGVVYTPYPRERLLVIEDNVKKVYPRMTEPQKVILCEVCVCVCVLYVRCVCVSGCVCVVCPQL